MTHRGVAMSISAHRWAWLSVVLLSAATWTAASSRDSFFDSESGAAPSPSAATVAQPGPGVAIDDRLWVTIQASSPDERAKASAAGLSLDDIGSSAASGLATPRIVERLKKEGISILKTQRFAELLKSFPEADRAYHDYAGVQAELQAIASASQGVASLVPVGKSYEGRDITAIRFNSSAWGAEKSDKPGLLLMGTHHSREHLSTETPLLIAKWIGEHRNDPRVKKLLETRDIFIVPLVNPDGAEFDIATGKYQWWRKTRRPNGDGSFGTDPNRNYDSHWCESGSSRDPESDTFCGPSAFSETETRASRDFILAHPNIRTMISYHTFDELILWPYSWGSDQISDGQALSAFQAMGQKMAQWTGYGAQQSAVLYPSSGDTCDWAWDARKIFCFTFELSPKTMSEGGFYPGAAAIQPTFQKNLEPALYLAEIADNPYRAAAGIVDDVKAQPIRLFGTPLPAVRK